MNNGFEFELDRMMRSSLNGVNLCVANLSQYCLSCTYDLIWSWSDTNAVHIQSNKGISAIVYHRGTTKMC